jgi:hypothetical protein
MFNMLSRHRSLLCLGLAVLFLAESKALQGVSPSLANLALRGGASKKVGCLSACFGRRAVESPPPVVELVDFPIVVHFAAATFEGEGSQMKPFMSGSSDGMGDWDLSKAAPLEPGAGFARWESILRSAPLPLETAPLVTQEWIPQRPLLDAGGRLSLQRS